jgi:hypothetical protein
VIKKVPGDVANEKESEAGRRGVRLERNSGLEALGGGVFEEMVQTPLGNCSINTISSRFGSLSSELPDIGACDLGTLFATFAASHICRCDPVTVLRTTAWVDVSFCGPPPFGFPQRNNLWLGQGVNETVGCAFTHIPTRGSLTELKEPCGALPRKCLFMYLFKSREG